MMGAGFSWFGACWLCRWWRFDVKLKAWLVYRHVRALSKGVLQELEAGERIQAWDQGMGRVQEGKEDRQ